MHGYCIMEDGSVEDHLILPYNKKLGEIKVGDKYEVEIKKL
jgi:hypothetical protein